MMKSSRAGRFYREIVQNILVVNQGWFGGCGAQKFLFRGSNWNLLNSTNIVLLPKTEATVLGNDFRPMSLLHKFAKIEFKLLANRLGLELQQLISCTRVLSFVGDRSKIVLFMSKILWKMLAREILHWSLPETWLRQGFWLGWLALSARCNGDLWFWAEMEKHY